MNALRSLFVTFLALFALPAAARAQEAQPNCAPDGQIMLLQDFATFDMSARGWRSVHQQPGCEAAAADLIARYRALQRTILAPPEALSLRWHEGQVRAGLGDEKAALALFAGAHDAGQGAAWNAYVDATVAFLKKDRAALTAARAQLAAAPPPPDFEAMATEYEQRTGQRPVWPPNLDVVDALVTCFDRTYREAFADPACHTSPAGN